MYLVAGATGNVGSVVAKHLLDQGKKVRAIARDTEKGRPLAERGVELAAGSLYDVDFMKKALRDVEGAFLLIPPNFQGPDVIAFQKGVAEKLGHAVQGSGVPHVVFMSSVGGHHPTGTGIIESVYAGEQALGRAGVKLTTVRPAYFMENYAPLAQGMKDQGILMNFVREDLAFAHVAVSDIGETIARALLEPPDASQIIELAGPREYSPKEVAEIFGKALGKPVELINVPEIAILDTMKLNGYPPQVAPVFADLYIGINHGRVAFEGGSARLVRGKVTLEAFAAQLLGGGAAAD